MDFEKTRFTVVGIICGLGMLSRFVCAEEGQARLAAVPAAPVVASLPEAIRHTERDQLDYYCLTDTTLLPGKHWVVATVGHLDKPPNFPPPTQGPFNPWGMDAEAMRLVTVGWLAIRLETGETKFLKSPVRVLPQAVAQGTDGVVDFVCGWEKHGCAVAAQLPSDPAEKKADPAGDVFPGGNYPYSWGRRFAWEWSPETGNVSKLGWLPPVSSSGGPRNLESLARALAGTKYHLRSWDLRGGSVQLESVADGGRRIKLETRSADLLEAGPISIPQWWMDRFAVTEDDRSIVALVRGGPSAERVGIRRIELGDEMRASWDRDHGQLEQMLGAPVSTARLIDGLERPCGELPVLFAIDNGPSNRGPLWLLDVDTGGLSAPISMPWRHGSGSAINMESNAIFANRDGRLILYRLEPKDPSRLPAIIVYDTVKRKVAARCEDIGFTATPLGFDQKDNAILLGEHGVAVMRWKPPYDADWECVFRLGMAGAKTDGGGDS